jgi:hypothetical protein
MTNIYGGCRAGGWESGLFSVDKIPADYRVKFVRVLADRNGAERYPDRHETETWAGDGRKVEADGSISSPDAPKIVKPRLPEVPVQTREIDLDGCVRFRDGDRMIIKTQEELLARIRSDASREFCVNKVAGMKLDIGKNILYGISISSGYCFSPPGLKYSVTSDPNDKNYTFHVFYERAGINKCHVIRSFDLWVLAPKEPDGYFATFDVMEAKEGYVKP